ncbi:MAG: MBL fold metallo-hydrolase [Thermoanaerobaculia bacterium]
MTERGVVLVHDQFAPLTERIQAAVATIDEAPIRFVLNTHWHFDHTGGQREPGEGRSNHRRPRQRLRAHVHRAAHGVPLGPSLAALCCLLSSNPPLQAPAKASSRPPARVLPFLAGNEFTDMERPLSSLDFGRGFLGRVEGSGV